MKVLLIFYLASIPLCLIGMYLDYKVDLIKIPDNIKKHGRFASETNRIRNAKRKELKKEFYSGLGIAVIPVINFLIFLVTVRNILK